MAKPSLTALALNILNRFISCLITLQPPSHQVTKKRMDNIYDISKDDPNLLVDEIDMIEGGYEAGSFAISKAEHHPASEVERFHFRSWHRRGT